MSNVGRIAGIFLLGATMLTSSAALARRQPPPAVIPTEETQKARDLYKGGRYTEAVAAAKTALNKNDRYTPPQRLEKRVILFDQLHGLAPSRFATLSGTRLTPSRRLVIVRHKPELPNKVGHGIQ